MLYDGGCRLCRFAARIVVRLDRDEALAFLPLDHPEAVALLGPVPEPERGQRWWLVPRRGAPIPGDAGGGIAVLRELRRTRGLARVLTRFRASRAVDLLDVAAARHRRRLGRGVPDGPGPHRFP